MSSFTDSEKVEYALKTTLNITMSKFGYAPFNETPAPPRVFPSNVMSKDLIKYGEGDLDENGAYVSGHSQSGNINTSLTTYESVLKYYKIVCPVTKKVSAAQLKDILGSTSLQAILGRQLSQINASYNFDGQASGGATDSNFWTKPIKYNFHTQAYFRGHYASQVDNDEKYNTSNSNYKGLNLAWNHIAAGTDVSAAIDAEGNGTDVTKIVPHLKVFLQVQTAFQIGAANKENQCFGNNIMKDMLGLDFKVPVQVNVGEISGDPSVTAGTALNNITGPGVASGNDWYTQSTAGTINFYAVGNTTTAVDNARNPIDNPTNSSAPMVTFLKYTGDHAGVSGLGGGTSSGGGGGGAAALYDYTTHTFTPCGKTGREGPTLGHMTNEYSSAGSWVNDTAYLNSSYGIQIWTVPASGSYKITACGGAGGYGGRDGAYIIGKKGAVITGTFSLQGGSKIQILVGQQGLQGLNYTHAPGGGGGGSFVTKSPHNTLDSILLIAGGGAGAGQYEPGGLYNQTGYDASLTDSTENYGGGTAGNGGSRSGSWTCAGAGFLTGGSGHGGTEPLSYITPNGGGKGGDPTSHSENSDGGFGGGGFGNLAPGGGGGFSGGNVACSWATSASAYGGSSKNNGTDQSASLDSRDDSLPGSWVAHLTRQGYVTIEKLSTGMDTTVFGADFIGVDELDVTGNANISGNVYLAITSQNGLYDFTSHTFTNAGNTGRFGPTKAQCISAYSSASWTSNTAYFDVTGASNGYQVWTVPLTGEYTIIAKGASDGWDKGLGATITATYTLNKGDKYWIVIGQKGTKGSGGGGWWASGGGGGTFMVKRNENGAWTQATINDVIIIAGGGGGSHSTSAAGANTTGHHAGRNSYIVSNSLGVSTSGGGYTSSTNGGGGGGGFTGNGTGGGTYGVEAKSFTNGLTGADQTSYGGYGGFGGGGDGGGNPGGGGGGVFGGDYADKAEALGQPSYNTGGDGGGSYYKASGTGFSQSLNVVGHGSLSITYVLRVGIGTTSPDALLQISAQDMTEGLRITRTNATTTGSYGPYMLLHNEVWGGRSVWGNYDSNNTKIGALSNNSLELITNATTRMKINHSGNIGIGTDPSYRLDVQGDTRIQGNIFHSNYQYFYADTNTARYWDSNNIYWTCNGTTNWEMCLYQGNLGIGTTSPSGKLHISGNQHDTYSYGGLLRLHDDSGSTAGIWGMINFPDSNTSNTEATGNFYMIGRGHQYSDECLTIHVPTAGSIDMCSSGAVRMMKIQGDGNIGIGTEDPQDHLHINKAWACMTLEGTATDQYAYTRYQQNHYSTGVSMYVGVRASECFVSSQNNYRLVFQTNNTERMRITEDGKIGIGTTSPTEKLELNGWYGRSTHGLGGFCGTYNQISGGNSKKTNPIYVIGSSYKPTDTTFENIYGIGFCHSYESGTGDDTDWPRCGPYNGWGLYVAAAGRPRIFMSAADEGPEISMRGQYPTIAFRDTNHRGAFIHVNSGYFYVLNANGADGDTWSTSGITNSSWALQIDLTNNDFYIGGSIRGKYGSDESRFTGAVGVGGSAPYSLWTNIGHVGESHGYEVLARHNSSKNGDWLYLDSNAAAPSGYHAQTADGTNMYFNVHGAYVGYLWGSSVGRIDFTGQHRAMPDDLKLLKCVRNYVGLIVISTGTISSLIKDEDTNIHHQQEGMKGIDINEAIPKVLLSTIYKQKTVYGVIADGEDDEYYNSHERTTGKNMPDGQRPYQKEFPSQIGSDKTIKEFSMGGWGTVIQCEEDDDRLFINSVGEGGIWVCDEMGLIENGDYITTSNIPGYGCVQDDDILHNYTVAKACIDCDFTLSWVGEQEKKNYKRGAWCIDKRRRHEDSCSDEESDCDCIEEDHHYGEHYEPECCKMSHKKDKHGMVYYPDAICHDASGCCIYETCCDCSGNPIMEDYYFQDADYKCKEITHNGKTYRIAFIACTYHCG